MKKNLSGITLYLLIMYMMSSCSVQSSKSKLSTDNAAKLPRIVNIVNFIRLDEPRNHSITKEILYNTVVNQINIMRKYRLKGTFLLQYDALCNPRYQKLLKSLPADSFEVGAWWEIPRPFAKDAGLKWEGKGEWDPYSAEDFSNGWSHAARRKLVDTYMKKFKNIFGHYPRSVGSWFIDAYTLNYMYKKYGIVASSNCKDQIGTDGYTLWGGYWNQAYYPSLKNAYMPAQHAKDGIPVPIFRMLGSDPIRQYSNGLGTKRQGVVTMEPVYQFGGGDSAWVHWYFNQFIEGEPLTYAYVQTGQENSFTWKAMAHGFKIQLPLIAQLKKEKKVRVETMEESGRWFRKHFKVTPSTAVTVTQDIKGSNRKTVWYDSRFYRANLLWGQNGTLRFRDIHVFDENMASPFLNQKTTSGKFSVFTLPFVDGHRWSSHEIISGLRFKAIMNKQVIGIKGGNPVIKRASTSKLQISWPLKSFKGTLVMDFSTRHITITMVGNRTIKWFLELSAAPKVDLPFKTMDKKIIHCKFKGVNYSIDAKTGSFSQPADGIPLRINPGKGKIVLNLSEADEAEQN